MEIKTQSSKNVSVSLHYCYYGKYRGADKVQPHNQNEIRNHGIYALNMPTDYHLATQYAHILLARNHPTKLQSQNFIIAGTRKDFNFDDSSSIYKGAKYCRDLAKSLYGKDAHAVIFPQNDGKNAMPHYHMVVINSVNGRSITSIYHKYHGHKIYHTHLGYIRHVANNLSQKYDYSRSVRLGDKSQDFNRNITRSKKWDIPNSVSVISKSYWNAYHKATSIKQFRSMLKSDNINVSLSRKYNSIKFRFKHHSYTNNAIRALDYQQTKKGIKRNHIHEIKVNRQHRPSNSMASMSWKQVVAETRKRIPKSKPSTAHQPKELVITPKMLGVKKDPKSHKISFHPKSPKINAELNQAMNKLQQIAYQFGKDSKTREIKEDIALAKSNYSTKAKKLMETRAEDLASAQAVRQNNYQNASQIRQDNYESNQMTRKQQLEQQIKNNWER